MKNNVFNLAAVIKKSTRGGQWANNKGFTFTPKYPILMPSKNRHQLVGPFSLCIFTKGKD
jgi:hypothetical protein